MGDENRGEERLRKVLALFFRTLKEVWRYIVSSSVLYSLNLSFHQRPVGECSRMLTQTSLCLVTLQKPLRHREGETQRDVSD